MIRHPRAKLRRLTRCLLFSAAITTGCQLDDAVTRPSERAELREAGSRLFTERCSPCHGATGHGDGALADALPIRPRDYHRDEFKWGTTPSEIATTIRVGRSGVMPSFEGALTEQEIQAVAYFVWTWIPADRRKQETQ